jgi:hypothetical protein
MTKVTKILTATLLASTAMTFSASASQQKWGADLASTPKVAAVQVTHTGEISQVDLAYKDTKHSYHSKAGVLPKGFVPAEKDMNKPFSIDFGSRTTVKTTEDGKVDPKFVVNTTTPNTVLLQKLSAKGVKRIILGETGPKQNEVLVEVLQDADADYLVRSAYVVDADENTRLLEAKVNTINAALTEMTRVKDATAENAKLLQEALAKAKAKDLGVLKTTLTEKDYLDEFVPAMQTIIAKRPAAPATDPQNLVRTLVVKDALTGLTRTIQQDSVVRKEDVIDRPFNAHLAKRVFTRFKEIDGQKVSTIAKVTEANVTKEGQRKVVSKSALHKELIAAVKKSDASNITITAEYLEGSVGKAGFDQKLLSSLGLIGKVRKDAPGYSVKILEESDNLFKLLDTTFADGSSIAKYGLRALEILATPVAPVVLVAAESTPAADDDMPPLLSDTEDDAVRDATGETSEVL